MAQCFKCGADIAYYDFETKRAFTHAETPHICTVKISLYENYYGIICRRREDYIAADIVREAMKLHIKPDRIRTERKGDSIILKP